MQLGELKQFTKYIRFQRNSELNQPKAHAGAITQSVYFNSSWIPQLGVRAVVNLLQAGFESSKWVLSPNIDEMQLVSLKW